MHGVPYLNELTNCHTWGEVVGVHPEFDHIVKVSSMTYKHVWPGMLVTCYQAPGRTWEHVAIGIVIAVRDHPQPHGDVRFLVLTLWNTTESPREIESRV